MQQNNRKQITQGEIKTIIIIIIIIEQVITVSIRIYKILE